MFDSGSQRSFISAELAHKYKLKKLKSVPVVLSTFGNEAKFSKFNLVESIVSLGVYNTTLKFLTHERVSTEISVPGLSKFAKYVSSKGV